MPAGLPTRLNDTRRDWPPCPSGLTRTPIPTRSPVPAPCRREPPRGVRIDARSRQSRRANGQARGPVPTGAQASSGRPPCRPAPTRLNDTGPPRPGPIPSRSPVPTPCRRGTAAQCSDRCPIPQDSIDTRNGQARGPVPTGAARHRRGRPPCRPAPTRLNDTRRDRPPCPSGLRANTYPVPVTRPSTLPPREPPRSVRIDARSAKDNIDTRNGQARGPVPTGAARHRRGRPPCRPAPTRLNDTRRDRPPCPSGPREHLSRPGHPSQHPAAAEPPRMFGSMPDPHKTVSTCATDRHGGQSLPAPHGIVGVGPRAGQPPQG